MSEARKAEEVIMLLERKKIKVLVVDDSAVMRKLIPGLLEQDPGIEVVATAIDGDFALNKVEQLKPDVVTLDIDMPRLDGITVLKRIVSRSSVPVIMLSSLTTRGAALTMEALGLGAVDFVCKPKRVEHIGEVASELIAKVKGAVKSKAIAQIKYPVNNNTVIVRGESRGKGKGGDCGEGKAVIAIGASSGGPHALRFMLPRIPSDIGAGIVIVQHMPESFTAMLARWLDEMCELEVLEARDGDKVIPGRALIAPGNRHMKLKRKASGAVIVLEDGASVSGHMPSVDVLFKSVAAEYGKEAIAIIMTGMGSDGVIGMGEILKVGGHTIAQDQESCAIFGMPRVAMEKGYVERILPLTEIGTYLVSSVGRLSDLEVASNA